MREGIGAPRGTPPAIVAKLNSEINAALAEPSMHARLAEFGHTAFPASSAEFATFIAEEKEKWAKVVRATNLRPD
jgi:tripartite-type tricarboxylate transporter receptor subunit TctC